MLFGARHLRGISAKDWHQPGAHRGSPKMCATLHVLVPTPQYEAATGTIEAMAELEGTFTMMTGADVARTHAAAMASVPPSRRVSRRTVVDRRAGSRPASPSGPEK